MPLIIGTAGDDTLIGSSEGDTINGLAGNDAIDGGAGNDTIDGGSGNDILNGGTGIDVVRGGEDYDRWTGDFSTNSSNMTVNINDLITISNGTNALEVEYITLRTGSGNDTFTMSSSYLGSINGGSGTDSFSYNATTPYVHFGVYAYAGPLFGFVDHENSFSFHEFEFVELIGSAFDDIFEVGGPIPDNSIILRAGEGDDSLSARYEGTSAPTTFIVNSDGSVASNRGQYFGFERYSITGGDGADTLTGGIGDDNLRGGAANDMLDGGAGADHLFGDSGDDVLLGNDGDDFLTGNAGADTLNGGAGLDTVDYSSEQPIFDIHVNLGSTPTTAGGNRPALGAFQAVETLGSFVGSYDTLISIEAVITGFGFDSVIGSDQGERIETNDGNDYIDGRGGNDILNGGFGNDVVIGGSGDDVISGDWSADILTGGTGADTFRDAAVLINGDTITDFTNEDRIVISEVNLATFVFSLAGSTLTFSGGSLTLTGGFAGELVASAAVGGGVQLSVRALATDARNDFNGDGRSDILWRNANGDVTNWLGTANGSFLGNAANSYNNPGAGWTVVGTGDFNGDGRDDIFWRDTAGNVTNWLGSATGNFTGNAANSYNNPGTGWAVAGTGDFNGDGRDDILWRNTAGDVTTWLGQTNGNFAGSGAFNNAGAGWTIAGTGDFDGDGRDDILWRNTNGDVTNWLGQANGNFAGNAGASYNNPGAGWSVAGTGDFNGDGRDDILWRNANGDVTNWLGQASGNFAGNASNSYNNPGAGWSVIGVGDYNGDGRDDVLWRHVSGTVTDWLGQSNGNFAGNAAAAQMIPGEWHVQPEPLL